MVRMLLGMEVTPDTPDDDLDLYDAAAAIPAGTAAAVVVLEHLWAIPLRDAIRRPAGTPPPRSGSTRSTSPSWA